MKTCQKCGKTYPDAQLSCTACGERLPKAAEADRAAAGHIAYLLGEIPQWVLKGWIDPTSARRLELEYARRRDDLSTSGVGAKPLEELGYLPAPPPPPASRPSTAIPSPVAALQQENSLSYWHIVGAVLLIAGLFSLARWASGPGGRIAVAAIFFVLTAVLFALAQSKAVKETPVTRNVLLGLAAALVPLDLVTAGLLGLTAHTFSVNTLALGTSLLCLPLYAWLAHKNPNRIFLAFLTLDGIALVHSGVQAVRPGADIYEGPALALAALAFAEAGSRSRRARGWAAATGCLLAAGALAGALGLRHHPPAWPPLTAALWANGAAALWAAWRLRDGSDRSFAFAAFWLSALGAFTGLAGASWPTAPRWAQFALELIVFGAVFQSLAALALRRARGPLAEAARRGALGFGGMAGVVQALLLIWGLGAAPHFWFPWHTFGWVLGAALLSTVFFWAARAEVLADVFLVDSLLLIGLMPLAHWPRDPAVWIALSARAVLCGRRRLESGLVVGFLSLIVTAAYGMAGGYDLSSTVAFFITLLTGIRAAKKLKDQPAAGFWLATGGALGMVLIGEKLLVPHWPEPNYGWGVALLALAALALRAGTGETAWTRIGMGLGVATVGLQMIAAGHGMLWSPTILLGIGLLAAAGIAWRLAAERAAVWTATFIVYGVIVFWLGGAAGGR